MASGNTTYDNASPARRGSGDITAALSEFAKIAGATIVNGQPTNSAGQRVYTADVGLGAHAATMTAPGAARSLFNGQAVTSQVDAATGAQGFRKFYTDMREEVLEMTRGYTNGIFAGNGRGDPNAGLMGLAESRFIRNADMSMLGGISAAVTGGQHVSFIEDAKTNTIAAQIFDATQNRVRAMKWSDLDPAFQGGRTGAALDEALKMSFAREAEVGAHYTRFHRDKNGVLGDFTTGGKITSIEDEASNLDAQGEAKVRADLGAGNRESALPPGLQPGNGIGDSARTDAERKRDQREEDRSLRMDRAWRAGVSAMLMLSRTMGQFGSGVDKVTSAVSGAVGGASTGAAFGPWGAVIGGILGALPSIVKTGLGYMRAEGTLNAGVGQNLISDDMKRSGAVLESVLGNVSNGALGYANTHATGYGLNATSVARMFGDLQRSAQTGQGKFLELLNAGVPLTVNESVETMLPKISKRANEVMAMPAGAQRNFFMQHLISGLGSQQAVTMVAENGVIGETETKQGEAFVRSQEHESQRARMEQMANTSRIDALKAASAAEADFNAIEKNGGFKDGKQIADFLTKHPELKLSDAAMDALDNYRETGDAQPLIKAFSSDVYVPSMGGGSNHSFFSSANIKNLIEYTKRSSIEANNEGADDKAFDNSLYKELGYQNVLFKYKTDAMKQQSYREQIRSLDDQTIDKITSGEASAEDYAAFVKRVSSGDYAGGASYSGLAYGSNRGKLFASEEGGEIFRKIAGYVKESGREIDANQLHALFGLTFRNAGSMKDLQSDESLFKTVEEILTTGQVYTTKRSGGAASNAAATETEKVRAEFARAVTASVSADEAMEMLKPGWTPTFPGTGTDKSAADDASKSVTEGVTDAESAVEKAQGGAASNAAATETEKAQANETAKKRKRPRRRMRDGLEQMREREQLEKDVRDGEDAEADREDAARESYHDKNAEAYRGRLDAFRRKVWRRDAEGLRRGGYTNRQNEAWHKQIGKDLDNLDRPFIDATQAKVKAAETAAQSGIVAEPSLPSRGGDGNFGGTNGGLTAATQQSAPDMHNEIAINVNLAGVEGDREKGQVIGDAVAEALRAQFRRLAMAFYSSAPGGGTRIA